ncbi:CoA pyrophosphatase [Pseudoduganella violaceinigra]|uniref:CoA pyrophosphatase n=1 Tax=Pseudoduganella violaceinigra TaxID=246602 RepID=UPI0004162454|nr:CoA pyrophosphatase [Pseudoduganella violaceinigra]
MPKTPFDPSQLPIEAIAGEAAVLLERLAPDWLRQRFAEPPEWTPEPSDASLGLHRGEPTPASVLVPLVLREDGVYLLLTMRTAHLNDHAGQVAFPGGRAEPTDADAIDTALRETEEEIGLDRRYVDVIGTLPLYYTGTGYAVTPVVGLVTPPFALKADPFEVAEIFEVPFHFLMDGANHQRRAAELPNGRRTFYAMPYQNYFIWGATAGMLRNLFHFLRA